MAWALMPLAVRGGLAPPFGVTQLPLPGSGFLPIPAEQLRQARQGEDEGEGDGQGAGEGEERKRGKGGRGRVRGGGRGERGAGEGEGEGEGPFTWLVLGGDPAVCARRVEQLAAR